MKYLYIMLIILTSVLTFFITRAIYNKKEPTITVGSKTEEITKTIPSPLPIEKTAIIRKEYVPFPVYIHDSTSVNDSTMKNDSISVAVAVDTVNISAEKDTIALLTQYYFPPLNKFRHTVLNYRKTDTKTIEYQQVYIEKPKSFFDHIKFGIGAGVSNDMKSFNVKTGLLAGLFYTF